MSKKSLLLIPLLVLAVMVAFTLSTTSGAAPAAALASPEGGTPAAAEPAPGAATLLVVAPSGNEARYRVREQLVGRDRPNDAVGSTQEISGAISLGADGTLIPGQSRIVVNVSDLTSDQDRRDGYVRRRLLEAEQYPTVTLVPTALRGLSGPLPTSGARTFDMVGNLTVRGVTRPTTWRATAHFQGTRVTGTTATAFTFEDFGLTQPRVPIVLSVADTIRLEYDFTLNVQSTAGR